MKLSLCLFPNKVINTALFLTLVISSNLVSAQRQPPAPGPSLDLALEAAQEAIKVCANNGYKVTATVVDSVGEIKAQIRADDVGARTLTISKRKTNTAIKYAEATVVISEKIKTDKALAAEIEQDDNLLSWGGARPLMSDGKLVGAIGVSGAPGGDKDDVCAVAAIEKIKARL